MIHILLLSFIFQLYITIHISIWHDKLLFLQPLYTNSTATARIGLARYFASTDNVHTSKFAELMLVQQTTTTTTLRGVKQIPFSFAPGLRYITVYIGGDRRYFEGLPPHTLPATLEDAHTLSDRVGRMKGERPRMKVGCCCCWVCGGICFFFFCWLVCCFWSIKLVYCCCCY